MSPSRRTIEAHLRLSSSADYNVRLAISYGVAAEVAIQCATINPARHMRIDQWVGSLTPGRYADLVLLDDVEEISIAAVYADGKLVSERDRYVGPQPKIDWPEWARNTMNIGRDLKADDFAVKLNGDRKTATAALLRPFHWNQEYLTAELSVVDGKVMRDTARKISKFSIVDRYSGDGKVASMFWIGCGPADADTSLACSVAHDSHNVWVVGSSDETMALAVNRLQEIGGGWVLVHGGKVSAEVRYEVGGLMTARSASDLDAEMQRMYAVAKNIDWMYEPSGTGVWKPGFPESLIFATLTCAPWRWVLVAPHEHAPSGFVNVQTGDTRPVVC